MGQLILQLTGALAAYGVVNSFLTAGSFLWRGKSNSWGIMCLGLFGLHCLFVFYYALVANSVWNRHPFVYESARLADTLVIIWIFPILYIYISDATRVWPVPRAKIIQHSILPLILSGLFIWMTGLSLSGQPGFFMRLLEWLFAVPAIFCLPYVSASLIHHHRILFKREKTLPPQLVNMRRAATFLIIGLGLIVFGGLSSLPVVEHLGLSVIILLFPILDAGGDNYRRTLFMRQSIEQKKTNGPLLNIDTRDASSALVRAMEEDRLFLQENLTLKTVADHLGLSVHQLSALVNNRFKKGFSVFVNSYRVAEAKRLLRDEPQRSVLSVGYLAGFNSKTAFQDSFYRLTNQTPGAYRAKYYNQFEGERNEQKQ